MGFAYADRVGAGGVVGRVVRGVGGQRGGGGSAVGVWRGGGARGGASSGGASRGGASRGGESRGGALRVGASPGGASRGGASRPVPVGARPWGRRWRCSTAMAVVLRFPSPSHWPLADLRG